MVCDGSHRWLKLTSAAMQPSRVLTSSGRLDYSAQGIRRDFIHIAASSPPNDKMNGSSSISHLCPTGKLRFPKGWQRRLESSLGTWEEAGSIRLSKLVL